MDLKDKLTIVFLIPLMIAAAIGTMIVSYLLVPLAVVSVFGTIAYVIVRINKERKD